MSRYVSGAGAALGLQESTFLRSCTGSPLLSGTKRSLTFQEAQPALSHFTQRTFPATPGCKERGGEWCHSRHEERLAPLSLAPNAGVIQISTVGCIFIIPVFLKSLPRMSAPHRLPRKPLSMLSSQLSASAASLKMISSPECSSIEFKL
ncbi:hypothetical protein INR49_014233 [Caranx melampygus]|nr:hypothetical protein INR49_014233 [Caranx melampygus]